MNVLLTGTYCSKNKGDAAMQQVFSTELRKRRPDARVLIASPFPDIDAGQYSAATVIKSRRRNLPLGTLVWLFLEALRMINFQPRRYALTSETGAMTRVDAVVDLSGDMLTEDYGPIVGFSHLLPLLQAQAIGAPVIICAQSIGPFGRLSTLARRVLARAVLITVRESLTPKMLTALGDPRITPLPTADLAFLLQPAPARTVGSVLEHEGIGQKVRLRLGVSLSALLTKGDNRHLRAAGTNPLDTFARALDAITESHDVEVLLVPHVFGPRSSSDDSLVGEQLAAKMRNPPLRLRGEYKPEVIKGVISLCDAFVGCRMHANIAALDSGLPVLAIGYSHKTRGIMADLGLDDWVLPIESIGPQALTKAIERLFQEAGVYRERLKQQLPAVRNRAAENMDLVLEKLGSLECSRFHE